ncbi:F-box/LRR-repeat protein 12-like [Amphiura filiformis]|uniref:F-box/LRR-repeat protein 12-like n=1 Tax=Amphiura filiformis TaxID=82378 RepID=UPI003B20BF78
MASSSADIGYMYFPVDELPDVVLVNVFSFFNVKQKCRVAGVSRRWNAIAKDPRLWKIVDDTPKGSGGLLAFIRAYCGNSLLSFKSSGHMTTPALKLIRRMCPGIQEFTLCDLTSEKQINLCVLPSQLTSLTLISFPYIRNSAWWDFLSSDRMPCLRRLCLRDFKMSNQNGILQQLPQLPMLTHLSLGFQKHHLQSSSEFDAIVAPVATNLQNLEVLRLGYGTEFIFHRLVRNNLRNNMPKLRRLDLYYFFDQIYGEIPEYLSPLASLPLLEHLDIPRIQWTSLGYRADKVEVIHEIAKDIADAVMTFPAGKLKQLLIGLEADPEAIPKAECVITSNEAILVELRRRLPAGISIKKGTYTEE